MSSLPSQSALSDYASPRKSNTGYRWAGLNAVTFFVVAVPALPIIATLIIALGNSTSFDHIAQYLLIDMLATTVGLVSLSTGIALIQGVGTAWLVSAFDFHGRGLFTWALALPLALPAYVSAYAWGDLTGIRGFWIAMLVYSTTLYPYIYLAARSAFEAQSVCALEAARALGASPWRRFVSVALPMARPAIAAGAALAALEMAADFGAADHLGLQTLTTGIFKAWFSMGDLSAAARLSVVLLLGVLALVGLERHFRRGSVAGGSSRWRTPVKVKLTGQYAILSSLACACVITIALIVPVAHLVELGLKSGPPKREFGMAIVSTSYLCAIGAVCTLCIAGLCAFISRRGQKFDRLVRTAAMAGYATPGAVTALGILAAFSVLGHGGVANLAGPLAIFGLCYAYGARFTAAGLEPISAGLEKSTRSMREAATTLGVHPFARFVRLEAPLAAPSTFAATLIVMVEIAKELPATTILRPFGLETLAVRAHAYAADERLGAAAWPALAIVALALVPTLIFSHGLSKSRAGQA